MVSLTDQLRDSLPDAILKSQKRRNEMYVQEREALNDLYEAETGIRLPQQVPVKGPDGSRFYIEVSLKLHLIARPEYVSDGG